MKTPTTYVTFTCKMNIKETEKAYGFYDKTSKSMQFLPKSLTRLKHNNNGTTYVSVAKWLYVAAVVFSASTVIRCSLKLFVKK